MSTRGPLDVAARWRDAVSMNDMPALGALYEPGARIWVNLADRAYQLHEHLARIASARAACSSWEYEDVRCAVFDRGYVSRHRVRVVVDGRPTLTVAAVFVELTGGGMFRGRWSKTTPAEKAVIVAIAQAADERGVATTPAVSGLLDANAARWSMARQSLIDKGLIEAIGRGRMRFTMPGFVAFVARLTDSDSANLLLVDDATSLPPATRALGPIDPHAALIDPAPTSRPPDEASPDDSLRVRGGDEATPALDDLEPAGP